MRKTPSTARSFPRGPLLATALIGTVVTAWVAHTSAQEVPHGKLAAAIRASDQPCARVIESERVGGDSEGAGVFRVRCNSGLFQVTYRDGKVSEVVPLD